jgi:predicted AlkP superfamily pyrophosphatase or phosphodiesterase
MRRFLLFVLLIASSLTAQTPQSRPKLVLVLSIDQMRFDYLTRFDALYKGGLRTLLDRGAVFTDAMYRHSATETGPGHSVILSGRHPSHSGIVGNEWYDSYLDKFVNVVDDFVQAPVGGVGRSASPANALSFTIGDVLKAASPSSHVVAVSLKDRSAILMGGRRADAAYWYEISGGNFITSSYYMPQPSSWLVGWNIQHFADRYAAKTWTRLLPEATTYERYAGTDAVAGEWDRKDTVFPHIIRGTPPQTLYYDDLRRTPFADEITLDFALNSMKAHHVGEDSFTDILAIGFSGTDIIGHTYGADSQEIMDQLLRLDLLLERLFKEVDAKVGFSNTVIVLTADHGAMPLVENLQAKGLKAERVRPDVLENAVKQELERKFPGAGKLIRAYLAPDFYFDLALMQKLHLKRSEVEQTAVTALLGTGVVAKAYTHDDLRSSQPTSDSFLPLFQNAFYEPRSPHLSVLLKPYVYLSSLPGGTGHGTAYEYDRHVPIIFMGTKIKSGTYMQACGPEDIAPTLAVILGLALPREHDSRVLSEMLQIAN